jgi:hypothetical protein
VDAGRRAEFADLLRLSRIAHVMHGEALGTVETRPADRADVSVTLMDLNQAAAAPGRRRIVADEAEIFRFFGIGSAHRAFSMGFVRVGLRYGRALACRGHRRL